MKIKILSIVLLFLFFGLNAAEPLKLNLEKDKVYSVISKTETNISQNMNGMQMDITSNGVSKISFKPLSSEGDIMFVKVTFDSIVNEMNMPGRNIVMNSSKPGNPKNPDDLMNNAFSILSRNPLEAKITKSGKVIAINNAKAVMAEVMKALDSLPQASQMQMRPMLEMTLSEEALKTMVETVTSYFPENNETEAWTNKFIYSAQGMTLEVKSNYKVKERKGNELIIAGESVVEPSGDGKMKMNGMEFAFDMRGMGSADLTVDATTGWIIKGKGKQRMKGSITANGMNIPMEIETKSEFKNVN